MYAELFIIDNMLMDALILKAAAAFTKRKLRFARLMLFSFMGALYALAAYLVPVLSALPLKLVSGAGLAFALDAKTVSSYIKNFLCLLLSACVIGGAAVLVTISMGGGLYGGSLAAPIELRVALVIALVAAYIPNLIRRMNAYSSKNGNIVTLTIYLGDKIFTLKTLVDTGSSLCEPLSGLPVAVAYIPEFANTAAIPIPYATLSGDGIVYALRPDKICIEECGGTSADILIAISKTPIAGADAIMPAFALPE